MKIALIGASGFVGTAILNEAVSRGHHVTAIVRDVSKVAAHPQVTAVAVDAPDLPGQADFAEDDHVGGDGAIEKA